MVVTKNDLNKIQEFRALAREISQYPDDRFRSVVFSRSFTRKLLLRYAVWFMHGRDKNYQDLDWLIKLANKELDILRNGGIVY